MNDFLPSRKVTAFILVPVITIFALWAITNYYSKPVLVQDTKSGLEVALEEGERVFQEQDTDGDGLKDWEEFLYQTDERNIDTDGDGASDGLEVKKGFDPLVAGSGTPEIVDGESESGITFYKNDPNLTKTDLLARDIFVAYRELKEGNSLDVVQLRDRAIEKSLTDNVQVEDVYVYDTTDIKLVANTTRNKNLYKRSYENAVSALSSIQFDEIDLFSRYVQSQDQAALEELVKNKQAYEEFAKKLADSSVPSNISQVHLELINNLFILTNSIEQMSLVEADPLNAYVFGKKIIEDEQLIFKNLEAISLYFNSNNL